MAKYIHVLTVNQPGKSAVEYSYDFGSTKGIRLALSKTGFSITAALTKLYDKEEMLSGHAYLFPDAIKKALLLYLLKFGKTLSVKAITVKINEAEETLCFGKEIQPPFYSMINGDLCRGLPEAFSSDALFRYLLKTPKSKYDKRIAALFAFLCSKSKEYETERFIYLWTSFNGMYGWISEWIAKANGVDQYRKEFKQIIGFQQFCGVGSGTISEEDKTPVAHSVIAIVKNIAAENICRSKIESDAVSQMITEVLHRNPEKPYNLSAYGYLLTQLSYYFRCKIIHGTKPIFLFSYADDQEVHTLKILNALLEEYIDENLPLWFDEQYIADHIIPKTQAIKLK